MILFMVLQCNTADERTDVLDFFRRTIPQEAMIDTGEEYKT